MEDVHDQFVRVMRDLGFSPNPQPASADQIFTAALLPGLLSKIGMWNPEARAYVGARQTRFVIHPSSSLARKPPAWVMAAELVETSQLFARIVAKLDPRGSSARPARRAGAAMARRTREQRPALVMAREHITLYGLPIVKDRSVPYARHDQAMCRTLFITHALVRHEYATKAAFMAHNRRLHDEVQRLRDKARRSDMLADEYELLALFFDKRIPEGVYSGKTFEAWRAEAEARDPSVLHLSLADLLDEADELSPERYPDQIVVGGTALPLAYRFEPGEDDDGITVTVPLALLPQLDPAVMAWTIPGWHLAKLTALLESLAKPLRKTLAPLDDLAVELAGQLRPFDGAFLPGLARAILERTGERVPPDAWDLHAVPRYLDFTFRVVGEGDKMLGHGRDLAELQGTLGHRAKALWAAAPRERCERVGLKAWDLDTLPVSVTLEVGGRRTVAYPGLVDAETAVDVRLLETPEAAAAATREGLRRLFLFQLGTTLTKLEGQLPGSLAQGPLAVAGTVSPRRQIVLRALDEAFGLTDPDAFPRSKVAFIERADAGRARLPEVLSSLGRIAVEPRRRARGRRSRIEGLPWKARRPARRRRRH